MAENLPDTTAMPEGAEYRREQRLERERGETEEEDCCPAERSEGAEALACGGWGPKQREEEQQKKKRGQGESDVQVR